MATVSRLRRNGAVLGKAAQPTPINASSNELAPMNYIRTIIVLSAVVVAGGAGFAFVARSGPTSAPLHDPRRDAPLVRTVAVPRAGAAERGFTGIISARVQSNLGFRVPGKVTERLVDAGERVRAGQALMRIDSSELVLALNARENAVRVSRAEVVQATADEDRYRRLLATGWAPRQRYEQAKAALDTANAQLAAAQAQAQVARNENSYAVLVADADGTVVDTLAEPGQVVAAGQPVIRLAHAGAREATINLPETARPALGSVAQVSLYGQGPARSAARLRQRSDAADPMSRTFEARYVLEGEAALSPLGTTVTVWLPRSSDDQQETEVPLGALLDAGTGSAVWVVDPAGSTVARRAVQVRRLTQESAVVTGLSTDERIVALGAHLLRDGDRVQTALGREAAR
jgi:RND family efflux transporter MFP subunit